MHFWMLKIVIFRFEGSKFQKKCFTRIGTGAYSSETTEKRPIFKNWSKKPKIWSWCVFFLIMCAVPILVKHLDLGGFRLLFWLCWGGRPGIGPRPKGPKVGILAIVWGFLITLECLFRMVGPILSKHPVCCRVLNWTPFLPLCARNMRKRSVKCVFCLQKIAQICAAPNGVHLCTHDFVPHFSSFFPLFSGLSRFRSGVGPLSSWKHRGVGRVWPFFPANAGGQRGGSIFAGNAGGSTVSCSFFWCLWSF